jgi:hypothetical protein
MSRVTRSALPSLQSEISILNAEKYGELPRSPPESRADDIVVNGKRSSPSDHDEEDGVQKKRSRGRPRLDTKDETAADVSTDAVMAEYDAIHYYPDHHHFNSCCVSSLPLSTPLPCYAQLVYAYMPTAF